MESLLSTVSHWQTDWLASLLHCQSSVNYERIQMYACMLAGVLSWSLLSTLCQWSSPLNRCQVFICSARLCYSALLLKAILSVRLSHSWSTPKRFKISKYIFSRCDVSGFLMSNFVVLSWLVVAWRRVFPMTQWMMCMCYRLCRSVRWSSCSYHLSTRRLPIT